MNDDFATTWSAYVRRHLDAYPGITTEQVGDAIDASATMVGNWIAARGFKQASADKVVAFWREFGGDSTLPEAMAAAGAVWLGGLAVLSQRVADSPTPGLVVGAVSIAGAVIWARRL